MAVEREGGLGLGTLGRLGMAPQPMSHESIVKAPRTRAADKVVESVCPYCAVGCGQLVYVKDRRIIDIEVQKSRRRVAGANAAYHDERVADFHHGRHFCSEVSCRAERLLEELD